MYLWSRPVTKILLFLLAVSFANAEIPGVAFKDVTKYFKDRYYSPVFGRIALDSGFIYNLRHFGPFEPAIVKTQMAGSVGVMILINRKTP